MWMEAGDNEVWHQRWVDLYSFPPGWSGLWIPPEKCACSPEPSMDWSYCISGQSELQIGGERGGTRVQEAPALVPGSGVGLRYGQWGG